MKSKTYKYIYGPVSSWRLGSSLGIDPISDRKKVCTFDCIYCQVGRTKMLSCERKIFVSVAEILEELGSLPSLRVDYITFSGKGEPTLAKNLGRMIKAIKQIRREKIAVLTNSSMLDKKDVVEDLLLADFVAAKLDAGIQNIFEIVNRPLQDIRIDGIVNAIKRFKCIYKGKLALQVMFVKENKKYASEIARIAREINPDEVQINTPLRKCGVKPLSVRDLSTIKAYFKGLNTVSVYECKKVKVRPISKEDTLRRRGKI